MTGFARALHVIAAAETPLTSRQLAEAVGIDYRRNFNKREHRYARKLAGFVVRRRLTGEEMRVPTRLLHWQIEDRWRGHSPDDIVRAFMTPTTTTALVPVASAVNRPCTFGHDSLEMDVRNDAHHEGEITCPTS